MANVVKSLFLSEIANAGSQPFDGMASGSFVDMLGRPAIIKREDLAQYVVNTKANIEATRDASGNVVGLPIDWMNHNHGEASGWIVDVNLAEDRDVIQFTPRWNELGKTLIGGNSVRYFSPEFDPRSRTIMGGSLTNWPATRTREQKILLRPIALAQSLSSIEIDESLEERSAKIRSAFTSFSGSWYVYAVEVFDGYLIARDEDEDKMFRVDFSQDGDAFSFSERESWIEVKQTYIQAAIAKISQAIEHFKSVLSGRKEEEEEAPQPDPSGVDPILVTEDESMVEVSTLTAQQRSDLLAQLTSGSDLPAELASFIDRKAEERMSAMLAVEQRKRDTLALASRLVGGTSDAPRGLPIEKDQLADFLLSLSPEQAEKASEILASIQEKGVVEFGELGHSREISGQIELPVEIASKLTTGELKLEDLSSPILAMGDLAQYNLSAWKEK
jgi:hypothetical protein